MQYKNAVHWAIFCFVILITVGSFRIYDYIWSQSRACTQYLELDTNRKNKICQKSIYSIYFLVTFAAALSLLVTHWKHFITFEHYELSNIGEAVYFVGAVAMTSAYFNELCYRWKHLELHRIVHHVASIVIGTLSLCNVVFEKWEILIIAMLDASSWYTNLIGIYYYFGKRQQWKAAGYYVLAAQFVMECCLQLIYYTYLLFATYELSPFRIIRYVIMEFSLVPTQFMAAKDAIYIVKTKIMATDEGDVDQPNTVALTDPDDPETVQ